MEKHKIDSLYAITNFSNHNELKDETMNNIESSISFGIKNDKENILESDSEFAIDFNRTWTYNFINAQGDNILNVFNKIGYNHTQINAMWFNTYAAGNYSDWQSNGFSAFSNIYMLNGNGTIEYLSPYDGTKHNINIKEGQLLTLPGFIFYRIVPDNDSVRTSIFFNVSVGIDGDLDIEDRMSGI